MKKKTVKKISNAYMKNRWFAGAAEPEYVRRETVRRGLCWLDNPAIIEVFPA